MDKNSKNTALNQLDYTWMQVALTEAKKAGKNLEVPVGAVLVSDDNKLITRAHNMPIKKCDPSAHAEMIAIRKGARLANNYRLPNSTLYTTLEPCAMCFALMLHARITRLIFATYDKKSGVCGGCCDFRLMPCFNHKIIVIGGLLANESSNLLKAFFASRRL